MVQRPARLDQAHEDRHRLPRAARVHCGAEAPDFGGQFRVGAVQVLEDLVARQIDALQEIFLGDDRREAVAFQHQAQDRDARGGLMAGISLSRWGPEGQR